MAEQRIYVTSPPTLVEPACAKCHYWHENRDGSLDGACKRRAPLGSLEPASTRYDGNNVRTVDSWHVVAKWPETNAGDFCGEFQGKGAA